MSSLRRGRYLGTPGLRNTSPCQGQEVLQTHTIPSGQDPLDGWNETGDESSVRFSSISVLGCIPKVWVKVTVHKPHRVLLVFCRILAPRIGEGERCFGLRARNEGVLLRDPSNFASKQLVIKMVKLLENFRSKMAPREDELPHGVVSSSHEPRYRSPLPSTQRSHAHRQLVKAVLLRKALFSIFFAGVLCAWTMRTSHPRLDILL